MIDLLSSIPYLSQLCYPYLIREIRRGLDESAPIKTREIETIPPTTLPTRNLIESRTGKLSGKTLKALDDVMSSLHH